MPGITIVLIVLIVAAGGLTAWLLNPDAQARRYLRKAERRPIAQLGDGVVGRIVGAARRSADGTLVAPLTGRPCLYYVARVDEQTSSGKTTRWRTVIREERGVPFVVQDASGRAIVDPMGARVSLEIDSRTHSGTFDDPTPEEKAFLASHGQSGQGWVFNKGLRYHEAVIEEDEVIAVLGAGVREPDPEAPPAEAYRGEQPTLLRLSSSARYALVISDAESTTRD